jgi:hypothetical protein
MSRTDLLQQISNTTGTFGTGNFTTSAFTPPSNSYLVVVVTIVENSGTTTDPRSAMTVSGGGWSYTTAIDEVTSPTAFPTATRMSVAVVGTGASMTLTVGASGRNITAYCVTVHAYTGYDTSTPTGATGHTQQNGGFTGPPDPVSLTLSGAPASTSEVIAALGTDKAVVGATEGVGWTEVYDNMQNTSDDVGMQVQVRSGSTSTSVTWQDARSGGGALFNLAAVALEIRMASTAVAAGSAYSEQFVVINGRLIPKRDLAKPQLSTVSAADVLIADQPVGIRLGVSATGTTIDIFVADQPNGIRLSVSNTSVAVDVLTADQPNGIRVGVSATAVTTDTAIADQPIGIRLGVSGTSVTIDQLVADQPNAIRLGVSGTATTIDVLTADQPNGIRVGVSGTAVTADVGASDKPNGIRLGISGTSVTIDVLTADQPNGIRLGISVATAGADITVADTPNGIRQGISATLVTIDQVIVDQPNGIRLGVSATAVITDVVVTDTPVGLRVGVSATATSIAVLVADTPNGIRVGVSAASATGNAPSPDVNIADTPRGIRLGVSRNIISTAHIADIIVNIVPKSISVSLAQRANLTVDLSPRHMVVEVKE